MKNLSLELQRRAAEYGFAFHGNDYFILMEPVQMNQEGNGHCFFSARSVLIGEDPDDMNCVNCYDLRWEEEPEEHMFPSKGMDYPLYYTPDDIEEYGGYCLNDYHFV